MDLQKRNDAGEYRKLTIKERFTKWLNTSRYPFGIILLLAGISWTVVYYEGRVFYQEAFKMRSETIIIYNELKTNKAEASTKVEEKIAEISKQDHIILLRRAIYQLESSSGTKGTDQGCKAKGLVNGYGLNPGSCYKSQEEVAGLVEHWIQRHIDEGMTDAQLLCHYNTGTPSDDCEYYQNYLKLN